MIDMLSFGEDQATYEARLTKVFIQLTPNGEKDHDMLEEISNV